MNFRRLNIGIVAILALLLNQSCEGYLDQFGVNRISTEMEFNPSFAAPIAYGSLSIEDLLEALNDSSGLVSLTDEGLIYIYFKQAAFSLAAGDLLKIPDEMGAETFVRNDIDVPGGFDFLPLGTEVSFFKQEKMQFYIDPDDRIDSILLKGGSINLETFSEFKHTGKLFITSGSVIDESGNSLSLELDIDVSDGTYRDIRTVDMSGWKIMMTEQNDSAFVLINFSLTLKKSPAGIENSETAGMTMEFQGLDYSSIYGHIATREITDLSQTLEIPLFDNLSSLPTIYFADPQLNIEVESSFGLPISLDINTFRSRSAVSGEYTDLIFEPGIMPFIVDQPDNVGDIKESVLSLNTETCNIDEILSNVPDQIEFSFGAFSGNPAGSSKQNFILDNSEMSLAAEVIMPLWFSTSGYTLKDTLDIDVESLLSNTDILNSISLHLTTTNEWPLELSVQLLFLDENYNQVGSLFEEQTALLEAAPVTASGELDRGALKENPVTIELLEDDFSDLEGSKYIVLEARVLTSDDGQTPVKFYSEYKLNYSLAISANFAVNTSDL